MGSQHGTEIARELARVEPMEAEIHDRWRQVEALAGKPRAASIGMRIQIGRRDSYRAENFGQTLATVRAHSAKLSADIAATERTVAELDLDCEAAMRMRDDARHGRCAAEWRALQTAQRAHDTAVRAHAGVQTEADAADAAAVSARATFDGAQTIENWQRFESASSAAAMQKARRTLAASRVEIARDALADATGAYDRAVSADAPSERHDPSLSEVLSGFGYYGDKDSETHGTMCASAHYAIQLAQLLLSDAPN